MFALDAATGNKVAWYKWTTKTYPFRVFVVRKRGLRERVALREGPRVPGGVRRQPVLFSVHILSMPECSEMLQTFATSCLSIEKTCL